MSGRYLYPVRVTVTAEQVYGSFRRAAPELSPVGLLLVMARSYGVEAGGGASIRNFNLGGTKAKIGGAHDWTFFATRDPAGPKDPTIVLHPAPTLARQQSVTAADATWSERVTCFRAFESLDAATAGDVTKLRERFPKARGVIVDAPSHSLEVCLVLAQTMKGEGYFADPRVKEYGNAIHMWASRWAPMVAAWKADA